MFINIFNLINKMIVSAIILTLIGICALNYENVQKYGNLIRIFYETYTNEENDKFDLEIEENGMFVYGNFYLPSFENRNRYDIECKEDVFLTILTKNNRIGYIPFRPSDINLETVTLKIKKITEDKFEEFIIETKEYIDLEKILLQYEEKIKSQKNCLAEAYD